MNKLNDAEVLSLKEDKATDDCLPDFAASELESMLTPEENKWFAEKIGSMDKRKPEVSNTFASGKPPMTCLCGKTGCVGCAGLLMSRTYGCQSGACKGGVRVPR